MITIILAFCSIWSMLAGVVVIYACKLSSIISKERGE